MPDDEILQPGQFTSKSIFFNKLELNNVDSFLNKVMAFFVFGGVLTVIRQSH